MLPAGCRLKNDDGSPPLVAYIAVRTRNGGEPGRWQSRGHRRPDRPGVTSCVGWPGARQRNVRDVTAREAWGRTVAFCRGATGGNFWPKVALSGTSATDPYTSSLGQEGLMRREPRLVPPLHDQLQQVARDFAEVLGGEPARSALCVVAGHVSRALYMSQPLVVDAGAAGGGRRRVGSTVDVVLFDLQLERGPPTPRELQRPAEDSRRVVVRSSCGGTTT